MKDIKTFPYRDGKRIAVNENGTTVVLKYL